MRKVRIEENLFSALAEIEERISECQATRNEVTEEYLVGLSDALAILLHAASNRRNNELSSKFGSFFLSQQNLILLRLFFIARI
jgi:hypothetical protein